MMPSDGINRSFYLPRLPREYYQGDAVIHWTLTLHDRAKGWLAPDFHHKFRELLFHTASRQNLATPIYCLMPDHIHLVWMGLHPSSDQQTGMAFLRTYLEPLLAPAKFQPQAHDHVLREQERTRNAFARTCFYIAANPVRAGLAEKPEEWPYTSCLINGYPDLDPFNPEFWPTLWKIYSKLLHPNARTIIRPPFKHP